MKKNQKIFKNNNLLPKSRKKSIIQKYLLFNNILEVMILKHNMMRRNQICMILRWKQKTKKYKKMKFKMKNIKKRLTKRKKMKKS